ncbi:MAG: hypothetical protein KCHDKBKB_01167 [Elusimicrobia bacterium]|nr:hypothetical protein [Elusimicrobiota bacterium]
MRFAHSKVLVVPLALTVLLGACAGGKTRLKMGKSVEGEVVEAEGFAPHDAKDLINTKRGSLVDAQRNAIEKAVGVFVSARTLVEKAVAIENNILSRTDGYIKKYDVLSEGVVENNLYRTRIRALVAIKDLERDLKDMSLLKTTELKRPRLFIELTEQADVAISNDNTTAAALQRTLLEQGFVVVQNERKKEAEIILQGKASSFPFQSEGLGGFVSYRARVTLTAIRPGTQEVLLTVSKEASGLGGNADLAALKSFETVGELAGREIGPSLAEAWSKGKNLLVMVEGVKSFSDVERVRKHLVSQPGVQDLTLRFYDEAMAQFEVQLGSISSTELAASLEQSQTLPLKVLEAKPQALRLALE